MARPLSFRTRPGTVALAAALCALVGCAPDAPVAPPPIANAASSHPALRPNAIVTSTTAYGNGPQACMPDSKLIGRFAVSTADEPGTWWRLTKDRFDALGVTDYRAALAGFYGQPFATLDDAIQYLIDGVAAWDENGNGYVCAFEVRGTRAYLGVNALYLLGIADDKHFVE